jgi:AcrR family transcriptional regulator
MLRKGSASGWNGGTRFVQEDELTETQRRIVAAALELFSEQGFSGTSTWEIAQRAGVAEKTLFANFKSKQRLFVQTLTPAALQLISPEAVLRLRETLGIPWSHLDEFLRAIMLNRIDFAREHPSKLKLIFQEILLRPSLTAAFIDTWDREIGPRLLHILDHFRAVGQLRDLPMPTVIRTLLVVTAGYAVSRIIFGDRGDIVDKTEVELMVDILVNGLRPRSEDPRGHQAHRTE